MIKLSELRRHMPRALDSASDVALGRRVYTFTRDAVELLRTLLELLEERLEGPLQPKAMTTAQRRAYVPPGKLPSVVFDTDEQALCLYVHGVGWFSLDSTPAP